MKHLIFYLILLLSMALHAQTPRETRAVWIATNHHLDWPPATFDEDEQKKSLKKIFNNIEQKNLNTVYFQVRSNGTTMYKSSFEPFSPYITGSMEILASYDPFEFAIEEAHKRGLEIHAWINTFRILNGKLPGIETAWMHLTKTHPEWILKTKEKKTVWLNPGIPEVRDYLVELITEIVSNYDVDGIHLDFIRYPQTTFDDKATFEKYGNGKSLQDWRRENITQFIYFLNRRIKSINPQIKLGVTPIGIYKSIPNGRGMEGYSDVFQNAREWLKQGIIDYAVPQIYWDSKSNPKFDVLVKNWVDNSYGRNIVIGIAAYKPEVYKEIEREINTTHNLHASGVAFFRYKNIRRKRFHLFDSKTLPAKMPWIKEELAKDNLQFTANYFDNKITLLIQSDKKQLTNNGYFAIYEQTSHSGSSSSKLLKVFPNYIDRMSFRLHQPNKICHYYYAIELDKLWNKTSRKSDVAKVVIPELEKLNKAIALSENPLILQGLGTSKLILFSNSKDKIKLVEGGKNRTTTFNIFPGYNYIETAMNLTIKKNVTFKFLNSNRVVKLKTHHSK